MSKQNIDRGIVQIYTDQTILSYSQPWEVAYSEKSNSTGFCIKIENYLTNKYKSNKNKDKYILTNSHCVINARNIAIRKRGTAFLYQAEINVMIQECDLAILSIDTSYYSKSKIKKDAEQIVNEFWNDLIPLTFGTYPSKLDSVYVYGYPLNGLNMSITSGTVNRIEIITYTHATPGIVIQVDAPINPGNSGGPAIDKNGYVIGVAFAGEDEFVAHNIGYIIPTTIIKFFLTVITKKEAFHGLCSLGIQEQELNNIILREYFSLNNETGILVTRVDKFGSSEGILQKFDIITEIEGIKIDTDGTVLLRDLIEQCDPVLTKEDLNSELLSIGEVCSYNHLIGLKQKDDIINLKIIRNKKPMNVKIKLKPRVFLIPLLDYEFRPRYYILSGLVFIPLTWMLYKEKLHSREYVANMKEYLTNQIMHYPDEEVIVLASIIPTEFTEGFPDNNFIVKSLNDIEIINLRHLYEISQTELKKSKYIKIEFRETSNIIILNSNDVIKNHEKIILEQLGDVSDYQA